MIYLGASRLLPMITLVRSRETVAWPWTKGMVCLPLNPNKSSKATAGQGSSEQCSYCRGHRLLFSWSGLLGEGGGAGVVHFYSDNSKPFMFLLCSVDHFCDFFCPRLCELTYFFQIYFIFICLLWMFMHLCVFCVYHNMCVQIRGRFLGVSFSFHHLGPRDRT